MARLVVNHPGYAGIVQVGLTTLVNGHEATDDAYEFQMENMDQFDTPEEFAHAIVDTALAEIRDTVVQFVLMEVRQHVKTSAATS